MISRNLKTTGLLVTLLIAVFGLLLSGCESKSSSDDAPSGMTITVSATPTTLASGATTRKINKKSSTIIGNTERVEKKEE